MFYYHVHQGSKIRYNDYKKKKNKLVELNFFFNKLYTMYKIKFKKVHQYYLTYAMFDVI